MPERLEDRAKEPVARCLSRRLVVPNIYFDAPWPSAGHRVDLLAIDRGGAGDIHVVEIKRRAADAIDTIPRLLETPAHYRWIAFFTETFDELSYQRLMVADLLYPARGMGRIGAIEVVQTAGDELSARIKLTAERFAGSYYHQADEFAARYAPDLETR
jgi:hypothetical protein